MSGGSPNAIPLAYAEGRRSKREFPQLLILLLVAAAARFGWMACLSSTFGSSPDLRAWSIVVDMMNHGQNPYTTYQFLNWPPFWMEVLFVSFKLHVLLGLHFYSVLRIVLIGADLSVLAALYRLLGLLNGGAARFGLLLWGYCLNPLFVLLTVQHGNFDAFAMIFVILFLCWLIQFRATADPMDWLLAAAALGMGIFIKTFPLSLCPLLACGVRQVPARFRYFGAALVVAPTFLSLTPLYVLFPREVGAGVIGYRSMGGNFGILGLLILGDVPFDAVIYARIFTGIILAYLVAFVIMFRARDFRDDRDVVLFSMLLLLSLFTLGSGYGSQYWFWVAPLLLVCLREYRGYLRVALAVAMVVIVATNVFEYGAEEVMGGFLLWWFPKSVALNHLSLQLFVSDDLQSRVRLPMSLACFVVLTLGFLRLRRQLNANSAVIG